VPLEKFNQKVILPYESRIQDFQMAMQDEPPEKLAVQ